MSTRVEPVRARGVTLGAAVGICAAAAGVAIGLRSLSDNSYFTHLATGRLILDQGSVPSADPYTFTASGEPWVIQSWLASVLYGAVERLGGAAGLRILAGATAGVLTAILWRLGRPSTSVVTRLLVVGLAVGVGGQLWSSRPFMFGLVAFALVVLAAEGGLDARWLLLVGLLWVNAHGSFPLGVVYLVVAGVGSRLDGEPWAIERRCVTWLGGGMLLGAVSPVGPRLLTFPVELLQKQDLLRNVIEWRAPTFDSLSQRLFLVQLVVAIVLLGRRPSYRSGALVGVFGAAALLGARNLTLASIVLVPVMAAAAPTLGTLRNDVRNAFASGVAVLGVGLLLVVSLDRLGEPHFAFGGYPVDAIAYLESSGVDLETTRMAAPDVVGNYLELLYGPGERVFYDDRFDMFPEAVSEAHLSLVQARPPARSELAALEVDLVLWARVAPLAQLLASDPDWRVLYTDDDWTVSCRRGGDLGVAGRC